MRYLRNTYNIWSEGLKGGRYFEDLGIDGRMIMLKYILESYGVKVWTEVIW